VALTVTATASGTGIQAGTVLAVRVLNNASLTQNGATATSATVTTPQLSITPGASGNWVYGAAVVNSATAFTVDANTTSISSVLIGTSGTAPRAGVYRSTSTTTTSATTYGYSAPSVASGSVWISEAEIIASGTLAEDASTPAVSSNTTATSATSASFTPPASSVLVAIVNANWTGSGGFTVAVTDSASAYTWTQLVHTATESITSIWVGIPKTVPGAAGLTGIGALGASGAFAGAAGLSGTGALGAAGVFAGAAALTGSGTLGATGTDLKRGAGLTGTGALGAAGTDSKLATAGLTGTGALGATGAFAGATGLSGSGSLGAAGAFAGTAGLSGSGSLGDLWTHGYVAGLTGVGNLRTYEQVQFAGLTGVGSFVILGEKLGFTAGLTGVGNLSIPQVSGGLVNGIGGGSTPQALPGASQVAVAPPGSSNWQWIGTLGHVTALTYSFVCPGGCDKMTLSLQVPASYRTQLFNPGWQVKITRGGHRVWYGKLDEPVPSASGWQLTAVGAGNLGQNFVNYYTSTWPTSEPDQIINNAIGRGLPWSNPGLNSSPYASQFWTGQAVDPGSSTVTDTLNLICTRGGLTWYVNSQPGGLYNSNNLSVFPLPTVPNRLLVCTDPVARTLGGDINTIVAKYMTAADNTTTNTSATYSTAFVQNAPSEAVHQVIETYIDLSDVGVMTLTQVQQVCNYIFQIYQRATFAGPFKASYGQLLNTGGMAIDPGTDQAGSMVKLILTDFGYGGEVTPQFPVTFIVGAYEWDDFAQVATITPYQSADQSLTGLLSTENTMLVPITVATAP
jgi:hypothetical protein